MEFLQIEKMGKRNGEGARGRGYLFYFIFFL